MSYREILNVWHEQHLVGQIWRSTAGSIGFCYDSDWISNGGFGISHSLPLQESEFAPEDKVAHDWFANLLPEGDMRKKIVYERKLPDTDFMLLRALGGECAGALSILPMDQKPIESQQYEELTDKDLSALVLRRGHPYIDWSKGHYPRLSLAGAQYKCPVLFVNDQYFVPRGVAPTSHILKFDPQHCRNVPAYEAFTIQLAASVNLPTPDITLHSIEQHRFVRIARYDRMWDSDNKIKRLHQEDFCQALGRGNESKYQEDGGPAFVDCYHLIQRVSSQAPVDLLNLLRWQIFNVLAGNSDGHAKNLSLLYYEDGQIRLAPFYDLICTRAIQSVDPRLALYVGGKRDPGTIMLKHWHDLAEQCDISANLVTDLIREVAEGLLESISPEREIFEEHYGPCPALQRIERIVNKQCLRILKEINR